MPTSITFEVEGDAGREVRAQPRWLHGLACQLFEGPGSPTDHHAPTKPFSVGPLVRRPGGTIEWWVNWLDDDTVPPVVGSQVHGHLGPVPVTLTPVAVRHRSYGALSRRRATQATIVFLAPTAFSRSGVDWLLPDPHLIFRGLEHRWNHHAPAEFRLADGAGVAVARSTLVSSHDICTVTVDQVAGVDVRTWNPFDGTIRPGTGNGDLNRSGFVGCMSIRLTAPELSGAFAALLGVAEFSGIGRSTTQGFGAVALQLADAGRPLPAVRLAVPGRVRPSTRRPRKRDDEQDRAIRPTQVDGPPGSTRLHAAGEPRP